MVQKAEINIREHFKLAEVVLNYVTTSITFMITEGIGQYRLELSGRCSVVINFDP